MLIYRQFEEKLPRFLEDLQVLSVESNQLQGLIAADLEGLL